MPTPHANSAPPTPSTTSPAWRRALDELADLYRRVDRELDALDLVCLGGGTCCRFDLAGHRLYVTTLELALLTTRWPKPPASNRPMRCPYQHLGRCTARAARPLGCRIHFCRAPSDALEAIYARAHRAVAAIHERHALPYAYRELTGALVRGAGAGGFCVDTAGAPA